MKAIIRAGGFGTRLNPTTNVVNKLFLPVYDKPNIYYSISLLIMAGITDITLCFSPKDSEAYQSLLGDGSNLGISLHYMEESGPTRIQDSIMECKDFIANDSFAVTLGDNVFFGRTLQKCICDSMARFSRTGGAAVFCKAVDDARDYGVLNCDADGKILSLNNKSAEPRSNLAVTGLFFFDSGVFDVIERTDSSKEGVVTFADLLRQYLAENRLHAAFFDEDTRWFDTGTPERLFQAASAVRRYQQDYNTSVGSIEKEAFDQQLIGASKLKELASRIGHTSYGQYLSGYADSHCTGAL